MVWVRCASRSRLWRTISHGKKPKYRIISPLAFGGLTWRVGARICDECVAAF